MRRGIRNASDGIKIPFLVCLLGSSGSSRQNYSLHEIRVCCFATGKGCTPSPFQVRLDISWASPRASLGTPLTTGAICTCASSHVCAQSLWVRQLWGRKAPKWHFQLSCYPGAVLPSICLFFSQEKVAFFCVFVTFFPKPCN